MDVERGSAEELAAHQLARLARLLGELGANPFYAPRLRAAGLSTPPASLAHFARALGFTHKRELVADQAAHPPYGTNLTRPLAEYVHAHQTSGTSGSALHWLDTRTTWSELVTLWRRVLEAAGVTARARVYFAFSFGPFIGFWLAWDAARELGCLCISGGALDTLGRLRAILTHQASVVCATPTYLLRLGEVAASEGVDLRASAVRTLIVAGEPGGSLAATRARLSELWGGARVFDHHGMTEIGPVTHECPTTPGVLHVLESGFLCEVVDPKTGVPLPSGAGELVLTGLGRAAAPLLRYRTGDLVRVLPRGACSCGRITLRLDGGILARSDDMVVVRGVNLYPSALDALVRCERGVAEYQVEVTSERGMSEVRVVIEPASGHDDGEALCRRLERAFKSAWSLRIPVRMAAPGALPRFELKARRWVRL